LNYSLFKPPPCSDVKVKVKLLEEWWCPALIGKHLSDTLRIGEGKHTWSVGSRL